MIKVSGCCDGCGKEADCNNINEFARVHAYDKGKLIEFDICKDCIHEIRDMSGSVIDVVRELKRRHGR